MFQTRYPESMFEMTKFASELHAEFRKSMFDILELGKVKWAKVIAPRMLTFKSPYDRRLMKKYQQMETYLGHIHRYKTSHPKDEDTIKCMDYITELITDYRRVPMATLDSYDSTLEVVANFHPVDVKNPFKVHCLRLHTVIFKPLGNHTFQRTFKLIMEHFLGVDIKVRLKYPLKQYRDDDMEDPNKIPHILQGEIASLNRKFKVSLDPAGKNKSIRLKCSLEDDLLPCVPPIYIDIPDTYPFSSPKCIIMQKDYSSTPFLATVQNIFINDIFKLPKCYSVTHLLNAWEMSVRRAFSPKNIYVNSFDIIYDFFSQECLV